MQAVNVYLDKKARLTLQGSVVEMLNSEEDIAARLVCEGEIFVAATSSRAMRYVECVLRLNFENDYSIKIAK